MLILNPAKFLSTISVLLLAILLFYTQNDAIAGTYLNSAHGGNSPSGGVFRLGDYAAGNCAHCHEQHASIGGSEPTPPIASGASGFLLFANLAGNVLCAECHDSTPLSGLEKDIKSQIAKTYAHNPASTIFSSSIAGNFPVNYQNDGLNCSKCHNAHVAQRPSHAEATNGNTAMGPLLSVAGVVVNPINWGTGTPAPGTEDLGTTGFGALPITLGPITKEHELCFACHAGQLDAKPALNIAVQFNINNAAVHPVTTSSWKNSHLATFPVSAMFSPWQTANSKMHCSDCHGSNLGTDPKGPHGSTNAFMLKLTGPGSSLDNLCRNCHNVFASLGGSSAWISENQGYAVDRDHDLAAHKEPTNPLGCIACHGGPTNDPLNSNIHGGNYRWPDDGGVGTGQLSKAFLSGSGSYITKNYDAGAGQLRCATAAACHQLDGGVGYRYR